MCLSKGVGMTLKAKGRACMEGDLIWQLFTGFIQQMSPSGLYSLKFREQTEVGLL